MARRHYSNTASIGTINEVLNNTDATTNITLASGVPTGWPGTPCAAVLELNSVLGQDEVVLVTNITGNSMTITRGFNGTATKAHSSNATITHAEIALDFDEANAHVNTSVGVHGTSGAVVGTTDTQTLTNKTLTVPTVADLSGMTHDHSNASEGGLIPQSSVTGLVTGLAAKADDTLVVHKAAAETITGNKTFTGSANDFTNLTIATKNVWNEGNFYFGTFTGNTDASSVFTINHSLGFAPTRAWINTRSPSGGANVGIGVVTGVTSTQIIGRMFVLTGVVSNLSVVLDWFAVK